jgi:ABC-type multidrug transport system fused ATPase/permease subunit
MSEQRLDAPPPPPADVPSSQPADPPPTMPSSIFGYVWQTSASDQVWLSLLAVGVFLLTAGPLELQRRIVNSALKSGAFHEVLMLCGAYAALVIVAGGLKLGFNIYRSWVSERAVRRLRRTVHAQSAVWRQHHEADNKHEGTSISIVIAETEPVGGFVGMSFSEPLLQCGILTTVFAYMLYLQPWMALFAFGLFSLQISFVPRMQRAINRFAARRIQTLRAVGGEMIEDWSGDGKPNDGQIFHERIDLAFRLNMRIYWVKFTMNFLMNLTYHLGVVGILLVGGWHVLEHSLEVGTVVAFISGLSNINEPWGDLVNYMRELMVAQVKYRLIADAFPPPAAETEGR